MTLADGAQIKLVNSRVRPGRPDLTYTVCVFEWVAGHMTRNDIVEIGGKPVDFTPEWVEPHWRVTTKPASRKQERHADAELADVGVSVPRHPPTPVSRRKNTVGSNNIVRLEVPGLSLRWEKVSPVLDKLAEAGVSTCTVADLRRFVQRS